MAERRLKSMLWRSLIFGALIGATAAAGMGFVALQHDPHGTVSGDPVYLARITGLWFTATFSVCAMIWFGVESLVVAIRRSLARHRRQ